MIQLVHGLLDKDLPSMKWSRVWNDTRVDKIKQINSSIENSLPVKLGKLWGISGDLDHALKDSRSMERVSNWESSASDFEGLQKGKGENDHPTLRTSA